MKKTKKILSVTLALIMIISIVPMSTITASAEGYYYDYDDKEIICGDYEYAIISEEDKTCVVEEYRGTDTEVFIPTEINGYTVIELYISCFYYSNITSISIPNTVVEIDAQAFIGCENLTNIKIPNSVTTIGNGAFSNCTSIENLIIPDSVISIGNGAFCCCTNLKTVIIGKNVRDLEYDFETYGYYGKTFSGCSSLEKITVDDENQYYSSDENGVLFDKNKTTIIQYPIGNTRLYYNIPENIISISDFAFSFCDSLTSVTIPDSVTTIGSRAFTSCASLTSVTIGDSVKSISDYAFYDCTSLTDVYYSGTEEQWNAITIGEENDPLLNATIHFYEPEHTHSYESIVTPPTCTEQGYTTHTCECGDSYVDNYVEPSHTSKTITIPATCTVAGMEYNVCEICGETLGNSTVLPATGHTAGEWEVVLEATYEADGKKVQKCTTCGEIVAEEVIPMLIKIVVTDEDTDISIEVKDDEYNGVVDIVVEESFDGTAFDVIDTTLDASQKFIYDITMTVDGVVTQPTGTVTVRIPLPEGYDPNRSFVYHVNTETGIVEKMPATYEDGYMVFETTHFSYYAIIEEYNYTFSIQELSRTEIRNKDGIILHANVEGTAPAGSYVVWTSSNSNFDEDADGNNLTVIAKNKGYTTFTAILCSEDGTELARDSVELYSKSGFFDKIGGFFRSLFGSTKIYEY